MEGAFTPKLLLTLPQVRLYCETSELGTVKSVLYFPHITVCTTYNVLHEAKCLLSGGVLYGFHCTYIYNIAVLVYRTLTVYKHVDTCCIYMSVYLIDRYFGGLSAHGSNWSSVHLYIP